MSATLPIGLTRMSMPLVVWALLGLAACALLLPIAPLWAIFAGQKAKGG